VKAPVVVDETDEVKPAKPQPPAKLSIVSPTAGQVFEGKGPISVDVTVALENYEIAPMGQHVHIILDNRPYEALFEADKPLTLKDVAAGTHTIRAFPSAGHHTPGKEMHESLKNPEAFVMSTFVVGKPDAKKDKENTVVSGEPLLTYSRPKGKYEGDDAKKIMLDFWVLNAELGDDKYKVMYKLDKGEAVTLNKWEKTYFENLSVGEHTVELWLVGPDGKDVPGAFNRTLRTIWVGTLFERLGGQEKLDVVVKEVVASLQSDKTLKKYFGKTDKAALTKTLSDQLCQAAKGPCTPEGTGVAGLLGETKLTEADWKVFVDKTTKALDKAKVAAKEREDLVALFAAMKEQLVMK
jgi:hypothetical protein